MTFFEALLFVFDDFLYKGYVDHDDDNEYYDDRACDDTKDNKNRDRLLPRQLFLVIYK
jgi:hypothetical protein